MSKPATTAPSKDKTIEADSYYAYDEKAIDKLRDTKPWDKNVKYFSKVRISALAAMKMLKHALAGVEKGQKKGSKPFEVMGLCVGKPEGDSLIITDTCALPVEGTETNVVANDSTYAFMTQLQESLAEKRKESFIGWYHSHPFDVETYSHCHLSATDVATQTAFQNSMPFWCAIVVDPLRSLAKQEPEFGCFRCYPVSHNPPANICPDGSVMSDDSSRMTRWGVAHHRYYSLEMSYFMSGLGGKIMDIMSRNSLWIRVLSSSSIMEQENRSRFPDRVKNATSKLDHAASSRSGGHGKKGQNEDLGHAAQSCCELALEQVKGNVSQVSKELLFNQIRRAIEDRQNTSSSSTSSSTSSSSSSKS